MNPNQQIERQERKAENRLGLCAVTWLAVAVTFGIVGIIYAWRHEILGFLLKNATRIGQ
jgi:hypothetical protein